MTKLNYVCPECGESLATRRGVCPMCGTELLQAERRSEPEAKFPVNPTLNVFCFATTILLSLVLIPVFPSIGALVLLLGLPVQAVVTNNAYSTLQKYGPDDPRSESAVVVRTLMKIYAVLAATLLAVLISFFCVCLAH